MSGRIEVLGTLRAGVDGEPRPIGNQRQARLLAALVVGRPRALSVDELVDRVWDPGDAPDDPTPSLRTYVNRLRRTIGDEDASTIVTTPGGYGLGDVDVDADEAEHLADEARRELDPYAALSLLEEALSVWAGDPYSGLEDVAWLRGEIARLQNLRLQSVDQRLQLLLDTGRHATVVRETEGLSSEHPFEERRRAIRSLALYRSGRQAQALRELDNHRALMREELGLDPAPELVDLEQRILEHDPTLSGEAGPVRRLRGYRLGPLAGVGAHSVVYRATQPAIGRDVAVKIIKAELANRPEFVRRFDTETQIVARLVHPHIVPIHDFWREPDRACLVMPWLDGGTLESRAEDLTPAGAERVLAQLGSAIAHAHRAGVAHNDITRRNVMLDADGNAFLSDFGIATDSVDREADLDAFRRMVSELAPGSDPGRFLGMSESPSSRAQSNPFRGLEPFDAADADEFFGREAIVDALVERVRRSPFTMVVGPSGSGKSSVLRAGVVPRLRSEGRLVTIMTPGSDPAGALVEAIRQVAVGGQGDVSEMLAGSGLAETCRRVGVAEIVVVIDQFEEVFALAGAEESEAFLAAISGIVPDDPVRVIAGLRADFYAAPLSSPVLAPIVGDATVALPTMTSDELTAAIVEPADRRGVRVAPELVARLVNDTIDRTGGLPLLQFALTEMWDRRAEMDRLTASDAERVGGIDGALVGVADAIHDGLETGDRVAMRRLFTRLVHIGDEVTKRRVSIGELLQLHGVDERLIDSLVAARLLTTDHDPTTREPTVELSHESLIEAWPALAGWIEEGRDDLAAAQRLRRDTAEWERAGGDPALLHRGSRLRTSERVGASALIGLSESERAFLQASQDAERSELEAAEDARRQSVMRRRTVVVAAIVAIAAVAAGFVAIRNRQAAADRQAEANFATLVSNATSLIGSRDDLALLLAAEAYARDDGPVSQSLLVEALSEMVGVDEVWTEPRFEIGTAMGNCVHVPEPGRIVVQPNQFADGPDERGAIVDIDLIDRSVTRISDRPLACDVSVVPGTEGPDTLYVGMDVDQSLTAVDVDGTVYGPFTGLTRPVVAPDGRVYARTGGMEEAGGYREVDPLTGENRSDVLFTAVSVHATVAGNVLDAVVESSESQSLDRVEHRMLLDPDTFEPVADLGVGPASDGHAAYSADGSAMAYPTASGEVVVVDIVSGERSVLVGGRVVGLSPSGASVAFDTMDGDIEIRSIDGASIEVFTPALRPIAIEWLDESRLAVVRSNGIVDFVTIGGSLYERGPECCPANLSFPAFWPEGEPEPFAQYAFRDGTGRFVTHPSADTWTTDISDFVLQPHAAELRLDDGSAFIVRPPAEALWVTRSGERTDTLFPFGTDYGVSYDTPLVWIEKPHDTTSVVLIGPDRLADEPLGTLEVAVVDVVGRRLIGEPHTVIFEDPPEYVEPLSGPVIMAEWPLESGDVRIVFHELDGSPFAEVTAPGPVGWARLSSDRRYVIAARVDDDSIRWFDLETGDTMVLPINAEPQAPDVLTDGRFMIQTREGQYELWDFATPSRIAVLAEPGPYAITQPAVSRDESHVWILLDGFWTKIPLDPATWLDRACSLAGRTLTDSELADFVPGADEALGCA